MCPECKKCISLQSATDLYQKHLEDIAYREQFPYKIVLWYYPYNCNDDSMGNCKCTPSYSCNTKSTIASDVASNFDDVIEIYKKYLVLKTQEETKAIRHANISVTLIDGKLSQSEYLLLQKCEEDYKNALQLEKLKLEKEKKKRERDQENLQNDNKRRQINFWN